MIEYDKFQKSLKHLEIMYENYKDMDDSLADWLKEAVPESIIQRFETCFDCMWKVLSRYLKEEEGIPDVPASPKKVFRLANENSLLASDITLWIKYADVRNSTSHDYSGEKAQIALESMEYFIDDAIGLYQTMSGKTWE